MTELPPLLGVPCSVKESIALEGMPNTAGVPAREGRVAGSDATTVARLRGAGAIPLGVTNASEATAWLDTTNALYGATGNAHDPARIPGGSSGGEGALVGAGGAPFGLGTDVGGSIRVPAFCGGVFGHKPSGGLVPGTGQYPAYEGALLRFNTTGPLARRAEDLMPLLRILAGPDGQDGGCTPIALGDPDDVDLGRTRVIVVEGDGRVKVDAELRAAQQNAAYALARRVAGVELRTLPRLRRSLGMTTGAILMGGGVCLDRNLGDGTPVPLAPELARCVSRRSRHLAPVLVLAVLERLGRRLPAWAERGAALLDELRAELEDLLGADGVLLYPSARVLPPVRRNAFTGVSCFPFTGIFNVLELPVTQVPLGLGAAGLPLGVQVVAAHGRDHLTIAVALELERAFGGWVLPEWVAAG